MVSWGGSHLTLRTTGPFKIRAGIGHKGQMWPLTTQKVLGNANFGNFPTHTLMPRSGFLAERTFLSRKDSLLGRERSICKALKVRENSGRQVAPYLDTILVTYSYTYLERTWIGPECNGVNLMTGIRHECGVDRAHRAAPDDRNFCHACLLRPR